jgi:hypothetical protein
MEEGNLMKGAVNINKSNLNNLSLSGLIMLKNFKKLALEQFGGVF